MLADDDCRFDADETWLTGFGAGLKAVFLMRLMLATMFRCNNAFFFLHFYAHFLFIQFD
jgi:hypothetical protein